MITCRKNSGFTMIEIMIAVVIIGLMSATIGPRVMDYLRRGKTGAAKSQLVQLKSGLMTYSFDVGKLPTSKEGLEILRENKKNSPKWNGPYLDKDPIDPWDEPYVYNNPPVNFKQYKSFEIFSYGPNGEGSDQSEWIFDGE